MPEQDATLEKLKQDAVSIWRAGVDACQPNRLIDRTFLRSLFMRDATANSRHLVVGCGKASLSMASALVAAVRANPDLADLSSFSGIITIPHGYGSTLPAGYDPPNCITVLEAGHPVPDLKSVEAVEQTRMFLNAAAPKADDHVIVLVSGGGSANWGAPIPSVSMSDLQNFIVHCMEHDVDIVQMNTVRRALTQFSGGGLLEFTGAAEVTAIVVSDVPGKDLSIVASGPTFPSTNLDALNFALDTTGAPAHICKAARQRLQDLAALSTKPVSRVIELANNRTALTGAMACANALGYRTSSTLSLGGIARNAGTRFAQMGLALQEYERNDSEDLQPGDQPGRTSTEKSIATPHQTEQPRTVKQQTDESSFARHSGEPASGHGPNGGQPVAIIAGGETTVVVTGNGSGGRNQECCLAIAEVLDQRQICAAAICAGTDGIDGASPAAGAIVTSKTIAELQDKHIEVDSIWANNDTYTAFNQIDSSLVSGHTHTNVMDLAILLFRQPERI